ncbi:MAG: Nif3-like dinuclear metal center hexameric protein [Candidatus Dadabacteria bacterium]|nr:MAG: Nif3-like dinuclear metal center hexameric protein [Candidatus Dadabacteria bacterium]
MVQLSSIIDLLDNLLQPRAYRDECLNGLTVEAKGGEVRNVALAVDAGLSIIEKAVKSDAQLLITHHGIFWGNQMPITGALAEKISLLLSSGCSLYTAHLPLDGNMEVGNAFMLAKSLAMTDLEGFYEIDGCTIGVKGKAPSNDLDYYLSKLSSMPHCTGPLMLPYGSKEIRSVAIVTGSGSTAIPLCAQAGVDLLISGEPKHQSYHEAKELKVNAIFAGHYATETFGVKALGEKIAGTFDIQTVFIDEPTGI